MNPLLRRLLYGLLSLVLLAGIGLVQRMEIAEEEIVDPVPAYGEVGTEVDARTFTIEVHDVELASTVAASGDGFLAEDDEENLEHHEAAGVWVVAHATLTAAEEPIAINSPVWLETGEDYVFAGAGELDGTLLGERLAAGIPVTGSFALDVPPEHLDDPVLRVNAGSTDQRLSGEAVIDLRLDDEEIARAADDDDAVVEITPPTSE